MNADEWNALPFDERVQIVAQEFINGERTLILSGSFKLSQGFSVFPARNEQLEIYLSGGIDRKLTLEEALEMVENDHCTNSDTAKSLLRKIQELQTQ